MIGDDDQGAFFDADEFATEATISGVTGPVLGIVDTYHDQQRPGGTTNSSMGSFVVGAADVSIQPHQFTTRWALVAAVPVDATLTIAAGPYAGEWRIKTKQRDGEIARLILNKR